MLISKHWKWRVLRRGFVTVLCLLFQLHLTNSWYRFILCLSSPGQKLIELRRSANQWITQLGSAALFMYSIGQKRLYLLQKVPKKRFPKKIAKICQALSFTCKGVWLVNDLSQKIPKLPKDLKQNVNWNQTLLSEGEVKLMPSISFLAIEVERVDCHSSACLTLKKSNCKTGTRGRSAVRTLEDNVPFLFNHLTQIFGFISSKH
jgi:hypothetical protein